MSIPFNGNSRDNSPNGPIFAETEATTAAVSGDNTSLHMPQKVAWEILKDLYIMELIIVDQAYLFREMGACSKQAPNLIKEINCREQQFSSSALHIITLSTIISIPFLRAVPILYFPRVKSPMQISPVSLPLRKRILLVHTASHPTFSLILYRRLLVIETFHLVRTSWNWKRFETVAHMHKLRARLLTYKRNLEEWIISTWMIIRASIPAVPKFLMRVF